MEKVPVLGFEWLSYKFDGWSIVDKFFIEQNGPVVKAIQPACERPQGLGGSRRVAGDVKFSRASRKALAEHLAGFLGGVSEADPIVFVTLTFGSKWPSRMSEYSMRRNFRQIKTSFLHELGRRPGASGQLWPWTWRIEVQGRGAPHFHIAGTCKDCLVVQAEWFFHLWKLAVGEWYDPKMGRSYVDRAGNRQQHRCVHIGHVRSPDEAAMYMIKEMAKTSQSLKCLNVGPLWGKINQKLAVMAEPDRREITAGDYYRLRGKISEFHRQGMGVSIEDWDVWRAAAWLVSKDSEIDWATICLK